MFPLGYKAFPFTQARNTMYMQQKILEGILKEKVCPFAMYTFALNFSNYNQRLNKIRYLEGETLYANLLLNQNSFFQTPQLS